MSISRRDRNPLMFVLLPACIVDTPDGTTSATHRWAGHVSATRAGPIRDGRFQAGHLRIDEPRIRQWRQAVQLKELLAEMMLENRLLKKSVLSAIDRKGRSLAMPGSMLPISLAAGPHLGGLSVE